MNLEKRDTQTQIKHEILERYLKTWGGIIAQGLKGPYQQAKKKDLPFHVRFVYVDCFAYIGRYMSESIYGEAAWGSPVIGIKSLDNIQKYIKEHIGFVPQVMSILIEHRHDYFLSLLETLELGGYSSRVTSNDNFDNLKSGQILVINADSCNYIKRLLAFTGQKYTKAFYLLDPYGPKGIPLEQVVEPIISQSNNDVMINFPYQDLIKKALSKHPAHNAHKRRYDAMYGSEEWRHVVQGYEESTETRKGELEDALVEKYRITLQDVDKEIAVKKIRLRFPDKERAMFYLFLTTHDGTGGLAMNEILDESVPREYDLRQNFRNTKRGGQLSLFTPETDPGRPAMFNEPDPDEIGDEIYKICLGETIKYREVLKRMVDSPYYPKDISNAVKKLKTNKQALYEGKLLNNTDITFK